MFIKESKKGFIMCQTAVNGWGLTGESECWGEDDVDAGTVEVKHDAKVDGYAA